MNVLLTITFRDSTMKSYSYEACACIEFQGTVTSADDSQGHYICDVKTKIGDKWIRTNDNNDPEEINQAEVSEVPYVVLFKRK